VQQAMLRAIAVRKVKPLGSDRETDVDVRLIVATNVDLKGLIDKGLFREDLYFRLKVITVHTPPLREQKENIPVLSRHFLGLQERLTGRTAKGLSKGALSMLMRYDWPGNVRELQNVVERAMIRSTGEVLEIDESFGGGRRRAATPSGDRTLATVERAHIEAVLDECDWRINGPGHAAEKLGLHPNTVRFRMKKLGIVRPVSTRGRRATG